MKRILILAALGCLLLAACGGSGVNNSFVNGACGAQGIKSEYFIHSPDNGWNYLWLRCTNGSLRLGGIDNG